MLLGISSVHVSLFCSSPIIVLWATCGECRCDVCCHSCIFVVHFSYVFNQRLQVVFLVRSDVIKIDSVVLVLHSNASPKMLCNLSFAMVPFIYLFLNIVL